MKLTKTQLREMIRKTVKEQLNEGIRPRVLANLESALNHIDACGEALNEVNLEIDAALEGEDAAAFDKVERHIEDAYRQLTRLLKTLKGEKPPTFPYQTVLTK